MPVGPAGPSEPATGRGVSNRSDRIQNDKGSRPTSTLGATGGVPEPTGHRSGAPQVLSDRGPGPGTDPADQYPRRRSVGHCIEAEREVVRKGALGRREVEERSSGDLNYPVRIAEGTVAIPLREKGRPDSPCGIQTIHAAPREEKSPTAAKRGIDRQRGGVVGAGGPSPDVDHHRRWGPEEGNRYAGR